MNEWTWPKKWPWFVQFFYWKKHFTIVKWIGTYTQKIWFYEVNMFFRVTILQFFKCVPKYLSIAQYLPNSCLSFLAGNVSDSFNKQFIIDSFLEYQFPASCESLSLLLKKLSPLLLMLFIYFYWKLLHFLEKKFQPGLNIRLK